MRMGERANQQNFFVLRTVVWDDGQVRMIDQTRLPGRLVYRSCRTWEQVADAIKSMAVRGAPAIGVAAAMGVALAAQRSAAKTQEQLLLDVDRAAKGLRATRPTAVNLFWGIDRMVKKCASISSGSLEEIKESLAREVIEMAEEDVRVNRELGRVGADLLEDGDTVLTQCNAGALATVGYGTALGVVRAAKEQGKCLKILVPETRPALQGARLTTYELSRDGFHCTLIPDTAVGYMMQSGRVDKVLVGADRITKDGYVFNKIGTYQLAVLARRHELPFFPVAPFSSFDLQRTQDQVTIEERSSDEVIHVGSKRIAPRGVAVANPAFDRTPPELVSTIVCERGLIATPVQENIERICFARH